ncbi:hypothetical protein F4780DRAFT_726908 [Xylariomycetidae sp. FL0641]|nr:hypothetical protein F4780DRAFT_726908 [Xylariomycetidae sp. FL0641]
MRVTGRAEATKDSIYMVDSGHPAAEVVGGNHGWNTLKAASQTPIPAEDLLERRHWYLHTYSDWLTRPPGTAPPSMPHSSTRPCARTWSAWWMGVWTSAMSCGLGLVRVGRGAGDAWLSRSAGGLVLPLRPQWGVASE